MNSNDKDNNETKQNCWMKIYYFLFHSNLVYVYTHRQVLTSSDAENFDAQNGVGVGYVFPSSGGGSSSSSSSFESSQVMK